MSYTVNLLWDADVSVWVATSEDIKGLVLESGSLDVLIERVRMAVPDLLKLNNQPLEHAKIVFLNLSRVCGGDPIQKKRHRIRRRFVPRMRG